MSSSGHSRASPLATGRPRGRALPWDTRALPPPVDDTLLLWTLAVREDGKRAANAAVFEPDLLRTAATRDDVVVVLGHSGPDASRWREARAVGPAAVPAPTTGRVPRALDPTGWDDVIGAFADAADACREAALKLVLVDASDDGLFASALSPLSFPNASPDVRRAPLLRAVDVVRARGLEVGVVLTVEDLAPGGIDPTAGVEAAQACEAAGATLLFARAGTAWFTDLWQRPRRMGVDEPWIASALWLQGRVHTPVYAAGPVVDEARALDIAREAGLAGVVTWRVEGPPP